MSADKAFDLLYSEFQQVTEAALWVVDENISTPIIPAAMPLISAISNRLDVTQHLKRQGWDCSFNDYLLEDLPEHHFQSIFLRIPKEKAQAHYIINQAQHLLSDGGSLYISGLKQEGIKGFIERAGTLTATPTETWKADKQTWAGKITFNGPVGSTLDDKAYRSLRQAPSDSHFKFWSKPGIFGWDKIDKGSELLIEHLKALVVESSDIDSALDIGCGYGYLSLHTARLLNINVTATDNNAAAIPACQANFDHYQLKGKAIADDCADNISSRYPLVICNPPFHSGFGVENDLTGRFLESAAAHLTRNGIAIFVVNLHIPLERKASRYFAHCETPIINQHFKLVRLSQPLSQSKK